MNCLGVFITFDCTLQINPLRFVRRIFDIFHAFELLSMKCLTEGAFSAHTQIYEYFLGSFKFPF